MSPYFPGPACPELASFRDRLLEDGGRARRRASELGVPGEDNREGWVELLTGLEDAGARFGHLSSYLGCMSAADAGDEVVAREVARKAELAAAWQKVHVAVRAALAEADDEAFASLVADERLASARYAIERMRERARRAMAVELEELAADLAVDGIGAWGRLYDAITGKLTFELARPGAEPETVPVAMVLSLLHDADPEVRRAAQSGAALAWERASGSIAACLNAIAGTRLTLYERRGQDDFLEPALFDAGIERRTLDAMLEAIRARQDLGRRYLGIKAGLLGLDRLGFQDLYAPLPGGGDRVDWDAGVARVESAFAGAYPELAAFARRAFDGRWIDHSPRPGKRPGGFCSSSQLIGQSRIFMTYNGAFGDVQILAHELGHAFHNWVMRDMRPWQRGYPMTLAETASTFAEQLIIDAALAGAGPAQRLALLDQRLLEAATFTLNIPMRFDFEHALYSRRPAGELSVGELKEMMIEAQRANFGDALDGEQLDPWYWASKLHFYITGVSFYNFPYSFGYLFSLGIFARARKEGPSFLPTYERLLRQTASAPAELVAREVLGVDLGGPDFWNASLDLIAEDLAAYEEAAAGG
jgi:oligoendopeptidase F